MYLHEGNLAAATIIISRAVASMQDMMKMMTEARHENVDIIIGQQQPSM
tara:strand:- start:252 stop:398 length:147 start_codon:yes stop_codon:yes gene_type:complete